MGRYLVKYFRMGDLIMAKRDDEMKKFGPKLLEAIVLVTMSEINILRSAAGLAPRTADQLLNAIKSELDSLPDYDWMSELL